MKLHVGETVVLDPRRLDRWIHGPPIEPSAVGVIVQTHSRDQFIVKVRWSRPGAVRDELLWMKKVWLADLFLIPELP